jgi:hypothetical protein
MQRFILAIAAATLVACASPTAPSDPDDALSYYRHQFLQKVGGSYRITVQNECFCPLEALAPVRLTVEDGAVTAAVHVADGSDIATAQWAAYRTVDQVFVEIGKALNDGARRVEVEYDRQYGYPADVLIDHNMAADAFVGFKLSALEILR